MDRSYPSTGADSQEMAKALFRGRFMLLVESATSDGCWIWRGPRHSSGAGRFLWRIEDGGTGKYTYARRVAFFLAEGEIPRYLRNLCGQKMCVKPSHHWRKPSEPFKPKPRKAIRGRVRLLSDSEVVQIRLLSSLGGDEAESGQRYGLSKRQTADIAMGKVRISAGGRIRESRFRGIQFYHRAFEAEIQSLSMRPEPVVPAGTTPATSEPSEARPFPHTSYGHAPRRRMRW